MALRYKKIIITQANDRRLQDLLNAVNLFVHWHRKDGTIQDTPIDPLGYMFEVPAS